MERGSGGRGDFGFGDPFAGFHRGFGRPRSLFPSLLGRDPFDDPFFTQPFGSMMGPSLFGPSMFDQIWSAPFHQQHDTNFIQDALARNNSRGLTIRELDDEEHDEMSRDGEERSSGEPHVQEPDEQMEDNGEQVQFTRRANSANYGGQQPQAHTYTFQSSNMTYGGVNGAYYKSSTTRRSGSDGITVEESREADTSTGKATHRVSRGIHDKGHSVTRKLNSDGRVDTTQMLHNLEEDELPMFEETWRGNARERLPDWNSDMHHGGYGGGGGAHRRDRHSGRSNNALPSTEQSRGSGGSGGSSRTRIIPIS